MSFQDQLSELQVALQYQFKDLKYLEEALTHKSFRFENPAHKDTILDNEKLEFLGDAVLDLVLSDLLMQHFQTDQEGALSKKRASLVNEDALGSVARELKLDTCLRVGKGERLILNQIRPRLLACCFEAVLGGVYRDSGYEAAYQLVSNIFVKQFESLKNQPDFVLDYKTRLQEIVQEKYKNFPTYELEGSSGPDHAKEFVSSVKIGDQFLGRGTGRNKKSAEQNAAKMALESLIPASVESVPEAVAMSSEAVGGVVERENKNTEIQIIYKK